jgi:hypothetical protein
MSFRCEPTNFMTLADCVERAVQSKTSGRIRNLGVHVVDGCVIVSGSTSTYYNKQLVTHAAMAAADAVFVMNQVEVCDVASKSSFQASARNSSESASV